MTRFESRQQPSAPDVVAPDGSAVRILLALDRGGMAHFELGPGETSKAVTHRTVDEIWYFVSGRGQMWRRRGADSEVVDVHPGLCLTLPVGTEFQFRSSGPDALAAIGVTMPPWPGDDEAIVVDGPWQPS